MKITNSEHNPVSQSLSGFTCPPTVYFKFITKCDKCYYKVRQLYYYKARQLFLLQSAMVCYYKVWQLFYYKVRQVLLQSATGNTKCDSFITKCHDYYKVRQYRQYSVKNQLPSEKEENLWRIFGKSRVKNYFQHQSLLAEFLKSSRQLLKLKTV